MSMSNDVTPSSAGIPSKAKYARRPRSSYCALVEETNSGGEYVCEKVVPPRRRPAPVRSEDTIERSSPDKRQRLLPSHPAPIRKPGYFKTAYKCFYCTRDGQDCYVPDEENIGPCLYAPCVEGGLVACCGHQRVNISEAMSKDPAALLRHRINLVQKQIANEGHKMSSTGEYLEWTPFQPMDDSVDGPRQEWAKKAMTVDPTLESDIDKYLLQQEQSDEDHFETNGEVESKDAAGCTEGSTGSVGVRKELSEQSTKDPLQDIIKDIIPKSSTELHDYCTALYKAEESLKSQVEAVQATIVLIKYRLSQAK